MENLEAIYVAMSAQLRETQKQLAATQAQVAYTSAAASRAPSPAERALTEVANSLGDTRILEKPKSFSGEAAACSQWAFKFRGYIGALSSEMLIEINEASLLPDTAKLSLDQLTTGQRTRARKLYFMLVMLVDNEVSQSLLRPIPEGSGYKAWRALIDRYEPNRPGRSNNLRLFLPRRVVRIRLGEL
jgi:hypothetical protein